MNCVRRVCLNTSLLLVSLGFLTGCWDRVEVNDLTLVMATGTDLAKNGLVEVTLQIALPTGISTPEQSGGKAKSPDLIMSEKGVDWIDGFGRLQEQLSRKFFLGHRGIIIIGEEYARHGIDQVLDELTRSPLSRYNCYILTAHGATAKEVLETKYLLEQVPSLGMIKIQARQCGNSAKIGDFIANMTSKGTVPITGAIQIVKDGSDNKIFRIDEAAVYRENKLQGFLSANDMKMLPCAKRIGEKIFITIQATSKTKKNKGTISFELWEKNINVNTNYRNGKPIATITFHAKARASENDTSLDLSKNISFVEHILTNEVRKMLTTTIKHSQKDWKADIFGVGEQIHKTHPYDWKKIENKWTSIYPQVPIVVNVNIKLERVGRTTAPTQLKKTEVASTENGAGVR